MTGKQKRRVLAYRARLQERLSRQPVDQEYRRLLAEAGQKQIELRRSAIARLRHYGPTAGRDEGLIAGKTWAQPGPAYFQERNPW